MTAILGISAFYHDSAAALVVDGEPVAAAQEERFTRRKHDAAFPEQAIRYCLQEAGLGPSDLDYVGFYEKPLYKFERLLQTYLAFAPRGFRSFLKAMPLWLGQKLHLPREMSRGLAGGYHKRFLFTEHHESHAASAFFPSPFERAAILTMDGVGEWATASFGVGEGNRVVLSGEQHFPHSLGLLYSAFTYYTGFKVNSGEHKLMGLAPYGEPRFIDSILEKLIRLKQDGSFWMDMSYFDYGHGLRMTSPKLHRLFGAPPRRPDSPLEQLHLDLAASIQAVTEEIVLRMARHARKRADGCENLCLAGGVALNCAANGRLLREGPFRNIWVQPASGDAGGALGTALFIWHQLLCEPRVARAGDNQKGSLLGPAFTDEAIGAFLDEAGARYRRIDDELELCRVVAEQIKSGRVVGWSQGRMEFGPRALGCRSILGDARLSEMQSMMNQKIKFRESFRPFAPVVLRRRAEEYFDLQGAVDSPYMLFIAPVAEQKRRSVSEQDRTKVGLEKLRTVRSEIPSATHVDYSARVQTVDEERHRRFYRLLSAFEMLTGCPVIINTSFNLRGEPIVCTPVQAYRCFMSTAMDVLVLENHLLFKEEQPAPSAEQTRAYLEQIELD